MEGEGKGGWQDVLFGVGVGSIGRRGFRVWIRGWAILLPLRSVCTWLHFFGTGLFDTESMRNGYKLTRNGYRFTKNGYRFTINPSYKPHAVLSRCDAHSNIRRGSTKPLPDQHISTLLSYRPPIYNPVCHHPLRLAPLALLALLIKTQHG